MPQESSADAAKRRLHQEMGLECELTELFRFTYREDLDNGLTEHELDHVFTGVTDSLPEINREEVMEYRYMNYNDLAADVAARPENYTVWFRIIFSKVNDHLKEL